MPKPEFWCCVFWLMKWLTVILKWNRADIDDTTRHVYHKKAPYITSMQPLIFKCCFQPVGWIQQQAFRWHLWCSLMVPYHNALCATLLWCYWHLQHFLRCPYKMMFGGSNKLKHMYVNQMSECIITDASYLLLAFLWGFEKQNINTGTSSCSRTKLFRIDDLNR